MAYPLDLLYLPMRTPARRMIRERYDLRTVGLPTQLRLMDAMRAAAVTPGWGPTVTPDDGPVTPCRR